MTWAALIAVILEFFGPQIRAWLESLFTKAESTLSPFPQSGWLASDVVHELFAKARAQTWVWQFRRRAILSACERVSLRRAGQFVEAVAGKQPVPVMTGREYDEVQAAL